RIFITRYRRQCGLSASRRSSMSPNIPPSQSSRLVAKFGPAAAVARLSLLQFSGTRLRRRCCRVNKAICRASESHAAKIPRPFFSLSGHGCFCPATLRSEEHTSELQSPYDLVCRLLLEKKKNY